MIDGTSQRDRSSAALQEGYFKVDEMSFETLLAMAVDYSRLLKFHNLENQPEEDWERFFTSDEAVIMALILTTDLERLEADFLGNVHGNIADFRRGYDLNNLANFRLARSLNLWFTRLQFNDSPFGARLEKTLAESIRGSLRQELSSLGTFLGQYSIDFDAAVQGEFDRYWFRTAPEGPPQQAIPSISSELDATVRFLARNFHSFYNAVFSLQTLAGSLLPESLTSGRHSAAAGLYIGFLKLFQKAQEGVNRFTPEHLKFYYNDILQVRRKPYIPDSTYLVLAPDVDRRRIVVPKGTELTAGVDEANQDLIYSTDNEMLLHNARVESLYTLHFQHDPLSFPENDLEFASGAKANRIPVSTDAAAASAEGLKAWPLFGSPKDGAEEGFSEDTEIGFALASPVLFLKEGERQIEFAFNIEFQDSILFQVRDIKDPAALLGRLREPGDPLTHYLRDELSGDARAAIDFYDRTTYPSPALLRVLVDELNLILSGESIHDADAPERFQGVNLTTGTRQLLQGVPPDGERIRLNRSLLEDAYPEELVRTPNLDYVLEQIAELLPDSSPEDAFYKTFREMFTIHLTGDTGWYQIPEYLPSSKVVDAQCERGVLKIQFRLSPEDPPVVSHSPEIHTGNYDTLLPVATFIVNPTAYLYPYSLLKGIVLRGITINVACQGVREVVLANNLGPLDPTNPFNPFGPIPSTGSYLVIGSEEASKKQLTEFDVHLEWGDLPTAGLDFTDHYQGYGMPFENSLFEARVTALNNGRWLPSDELAQQQVKLFHSTESDFETGATPTIGWSAIKRNQVSVSEATIRNFNPARGIPADGEMVYNSLSKNGFFKLTLSSPNYAFGHKDYPVKLTEVLTANALLKKVELSRPAPNPPYTPQINVISLDYRAVAKFNLEQIGPSKGSQSQERIFHLHPFGLESLTPSADPSLYLMPQYHAEGNLFIGLSARQLSGMLTLFFHLRDDCSPEAEEGSAGLSWHYLASNRWHKLDRPRIVSDTTEGFLTSGIVTLDLPEGINRDNTTMPGNLFWLRASAHNNSDTLCSLHSVHAQALKVSWQHQENDVARLRQQLPAGTIKEARVSIPGVGSISQIVPSFGGRAPETADKVTIRTSERLRHKNRAVHPWDYERLVLEAFPEILKVKCFANLVAETGQENIVRPGQVSIAVIPQPKALPAVHLRPMANGLELREIHDFVAKHASPFATFKVRNPTYEQIQVRCTVKFNDGIREGQHIQRLNRAVSDYISPWIDTVGYSPQFGWCVRRHEIESFIRGLDFVDFVTNFSMLRISDDDQGYYRLSDTVTETSDFDEISPRYPWSIAVPAQSHAIETVDRFQTIDAEITGIEELEIGSTFIITDK